MRVLSAKMKQQDAMIEKDPVDPRIPKVGNEINSLLERANRRMEP